MTLYTCGFFVYKNNLKSPYKSAIVLDLYTDFVASKSSGVSSCVNCRGHKTAHNSTYSKQNSPLCTSG